MALTLSGPASAGLLVSIVTVVPAAITATAIPRTRYLQARQTTNDPLDQEINTARRHRPPDVAESGAVPGGRVAGAGVLGRLCAGRLGLSEESGREKPCQ